MTQAEEIAELKSQIAELKSRFDAKDAPPAPVKMVQSKPVELEGTTVSYPQPRSAFIMPDETSLHSLLRVVFANVPKLNQTDGLVFRGDAKQNEAEYFKQFCASFRALGALHRTEKPDRKRYVSYWIDVCEDLLKSMGNSTTLSGLPFLAAALSHGDIAYAGLFTEGCVPELGLNAYRMGKPPGDAWKQVLSTGRIIPMILPPSSRNYPTPPFRIVDVA
jgi:hypothetical protein